LKTKELIRQLQEADPSGELECAIGGNVDIISVYALPAYYDGYLEILERDHSKDPYYNICGAIITGEGSKVRIDPYSVEDAIFDNVDLPVKIIGDSNNIRRKGIEKYREKAKQIYKEIEDQRKNKNR